jgi:hypothetical protein
MDVVLGCVLCIGIGLIAILYFIEMVIKLILWILDNKEE